MTLKAFIRFLLYKPVLRLVARLSSRPDQARVDLALTRLHLDIVGSPGKRGPVIRFDPAAGRFIIFSDQHKGARNGSDDFALAEPNYLHALRYYEQEGFHFISLGDNEELWENTLNEVKRFNQSSFEAEKNFINRNAFTKIFGNHDLYWDNDPFASFQLKEIYQTTVKVYEGILLQTKINETPLTIYCTHGHQGDVQSDGNWFSKFFVARIWAPLQNYLNINPNTPSCNDMLKTDHNRMMYEWSSRQKNLLLITGHTHQPVFASLTHLERLQRKEEDIVKPTYFNSGCCCFDDGDITGIEIAEGKIRLVKWDSKRSPVSERIVLEEASLESLISRQ